MQLESLAEPNLAGRNRELKELQQYLQSMAQGKGTTVFISGEAGSGKTRLASEFLELAKAQGTTVLMGWCLSNVVVPYFPFIEALDSYSTSGYGNQHSGAQLTTIKTWLTGSNTADGVASSPQAWKDQAFMTVARELLELSMKSPLVLFIDDLHWADSASLSLLSYLARCVTSERIIILAAYRSEEVDVSPQGSRNQLKDVQRLMARSDLYHEIRIGNLNQIEVCSIVEGMLGGRAHTSLVEKLSASSQGLPLFVVESMRMLFEQHELTEVNNQWQLTVREISIPLKVKDIIYRRIDFLKPSQKRILDIAAVIGEKFDPQLVAAVVAKDSINVLESLNYMANNTLLVHCEGDYYWFNHAKYREMLYETIPQLLKKEYHLRIAKILEVNDRSPKELPVNDLAWHYAKGGNIEKSIKYAVIAGKLALSRFSNNEALEHFSYALNNCSQQPDYKEIWVEASEGLGEGFFANGRFEQALKTFEELGDCTAGIVKLRAYRRAMDSAFFMGEFQKLSTLTKKAEEYSVFDRLESARILMNRARAVTFLGNNKVGLADFEAALDIFEKENSLPDIARVLLGLGGASHRQWKLEKGIANALRAILYFKELGDLRGLADAYNRAGQSFGYRMLNQEALGMHQEAVRIGEKIGHYNRVAEAYASMSWVYEAMDQYPQALSASLKALEYAKKTGSQWTNAIVYANLSVIYSKSGELEQAEAYYNYLLTMPKEIVTNAFVRLNACKKSLALAKKHWPDVNQYFQESISSLENGANPSAELRLRNDYADALEKQGKLNEATIQRSQVQRVLRRIRHAFEHSNLYAFFLAPRQLEFSKDFQVRFDISKYFCRTCGDYRNRRVNTPRI